MSENNNLDENVAQEQLDEIDVQDEFQQTGDDLDDQISNSSYEFSLPEERLKFEMEDNNEVCEHNSTNDTREVFYLKFRATIDGESLDDLIVYKYCPIDLHSMFGLFGHITDRSYFSIKIGTINWKRSIITFEELTAVHTNIKDVYEKNILPKSYPPNLIDGFVLKFEIGNGWHYFDAKMDAHGQLQATRLDSLMDKIAHVVDNESAYKIVTTTSEDGENVKEVELVKYSIGTGETTRFPTTNWEILDFPEVFFRLGKRIIVKHYDHISAKRRIYSLDLDTLKWNREIEMNDLIAVSTDGQRVLIVHTCYEYRSRKIYRCVFNEPDSLGTLVWLRLKRIFDKRPEAYDFIIGELPKNFKQKCPF